MNSIEPDGDALEDLDEQLAVAASNGLCAHDLRPLARYLRESPLCQMHPAIWTALLGYIDGYVAPDGSDGFVLAVVRPPGAKRLRRSIIETERIRAITLRAFAAFQRMEGSKPGHYEAGIWQAAAETGVSVQRIKQLLTPAYRAAVIETISNVYASKATNIYTLLAGGRDIIKPPLGLKVLIRENYLIDVID